MQELAKLWSVSDCEELVGVIHKRCGGKLWKIVKSDKRSGSNIFNRCSVQLKSFARTD